MRLCEVTSAAVNRSEAKAKRFRPPWCSNLAQVEFRPAPKSDPLHGRQEKAQKVMMLRDSSNKTMRDVYGQVVLGKKITAEEGMQKSCLQEVVGRGQTG